MTNNMFNNNGIYLVTDTHQCGRRGVVATAQAAVANGVTTVQVRDKNADAADLLALLVAVAQAVGERATVLVDDRVDVFLAARQHGAAVHGVHVGQRDIPVAAVRAMLGPKAIVGLTANTPAHVAAVHKLPAGTVDYLGVGAIHATQTKPGHPPALGVDGFAQFVATTHLPCVAIGGIDVADVGPLRRAGAAAVAVVSAVCTADDAAAATHKLQAAWGAGA